MDWQRAYTDVCMNDLQSAYNQLAVAASAEVENFVLTVPEMLVSEHYKGTLLDVGCGNGRFAATLLKNEMVSSARVIDVSDICIDYARKAFEKCQVVGEVVRQSIENYSTLDRFDIITCWEVIEHLRRPDLVLSLFGRILEPDGAIVGSVPEGLAQNNILHLHHFYNVDLLKMLSEHFDDIRIIRYFCEESKSIRLIFVAKQAKVNHA